MAESVFVRENRSYAWKHNRATERNWTGSHLFSSPKLDVGDGSVISIFHIANSGSSNKQRELVSWKQLSRPSRPLKLFQYIAFFLQTRDNKSYVRFS
mmetsp:Transcript_30774/g.73855  ORF Transcript_30774/g.73855 Transcript_30774/m.73855 type:complete len:97 (+) Transcript_30774:249-539(+)